MISKHMKNPYVSCIVIYQWAVIEYKLTEELSTAQCALDGIQQLSDVRHSADQLRPAAGRPY